MPVITAFVPEKTFSQTENRTLESFPALSVKSVMDRKYMTGIDNYISDHFAGRDSWIRIKTWFEKSFGKYERNGIYILKNRMVEKLSNPDYLSVDKSISAINKFASENETPVFFMLVPTSAAIYSDELPKYTPNLNQRDFISYVNGGLEANVTSLDVYNDLSAVRGQYIYYRTDHHWTSLGAYTAYTAVGKKMGYTPYELKYFDIEHAGIDFAGTFYSKTIYDKVNNDVVDIYHFNNEDSFNSFTTTSEIGNEPETYDSIYFRDYLKQKDKYSVFLGPNQPIVTIKNENSKGKLLIIKDSYAHCYVPFLMQHYSEITILDLRYIQTAYNNIVDINNYDQVLILYNVSTFISDINIRKLGYTE